MEVQLARLEFAKIMLKKFSILIKGKHINFMVNCMVQEVHNMDQIVGCPELLISQNPTNA